MYYQLPFPFSHLSADLFFESSRTAGALWVFGPQLLKRQSQAGIRADNEMGSGQNWQDGRICGICGISRICTEQPKNPRAG